jgi:hypothetical protein
MDLSFTIAAATDRIENTVSNNSFVVGVFTDPLPSYGRLRLSGVMTQYEKHQSG